MLNGVDGGADDEHLLNGNASDTSFADGVLGGAHGVSGGRNVDSDVDNNEMLGTKKINTGRSLFRKYKAYTTEI